jgi:3-oxoacyl-[acyl-carrier protein] reductase
MMTTDLKNKVALVTGASRGIGAAIAERLAARHAKVVINYASSPAAATSLLDRIVQTGGTAMVAQGDVSNPASIESVFDAAISSFGKVDIVVANAGIELVGKATVDVTEEEFDRLFAVNSKGTFFTLQQAAKRLEDNGRIVLIGSSTGEFPMPGHALYGASKMAPRFLVEVLAKELGARGITVNSILPTVTEGAGVSTEGARDSVREYLRTFNPMRRAASLKDVADTVEYLVSDLANYISGQHLLLSGGAPA